MFAYQWVEQRLIIFLVMQSCMRVSVGDGRLSALHNFYYEAVVVRYNWRVISGWCSSPAFSPDSSGFLRCECVHAG